VSADALFFGPHPDDVELSSGGLATLLASHGHRVVVVDLTRGEAASRGSIDTRHLEARAAAEILGVERENLGLPDLGIQRAAHVQLRAIVTCIRRHRPHLVVAPDRDDAHPDHVEAAHLITRACYLSGLVRFDAPGERFRPARLMYALYRTLRVPDLIVDVSAVWERRMEALRAHRSQLDPAAEGPATYLTAPGFLGELEARARTWGASIGVTYGEAYRVRGPVPVTDARALLEHGRAQGNP
jgi:bacillithiol biosynthesis deacetylase BshB1